MFSAPHLFYWKHFVRGLALCMCIFSTANAQEYGASNQQAEPTTTVYKIVNPDGSVSFSDQPGNKAETLHISPVPTVPALSPQQINKAYQEQPQPSVTVPAYQSLNIVSPADQTAFNSGSGDVSVVLEVYPDLDSNHDIEIRLDNKVITRGKQTQFTLPTVSRGTHSLQARILSPSGQVLKQATSSFTLHRPSIAR